jgi:hypothetical protein
MHSLATISKLNTLASIAKERARAQAMNNPGGHAKDSEKGRVGEIIRRHAKTQRELAKEKRQFKKHLELASAAIAKERFRAQAMNNPKGHAKDAEKGRRAVYKNLPKHLAKNLAADAVKEKGRTKKVRPYPKFPHPTETVVGGF